MADRTTGEGQGRKDRRPMYFLSREEAESLAFGSVSSSEAWDVGGGATQASCREKTSVRLRKLLPPRKTHGQTNARPSRPTWRSGPRADAGALGAATTEALGSRI
jgi:hypothetical protein